jgi:nucleoside-diphosphate-sugar epimerase
MRVFVAGATGAIGRPLVRRLVDAGHEVTGMTRSPDKASWLEEVGATAVVCDARDREATMATIRAREPEVVIDELTDLPKSLNVFRFRHFYDRQTELKETAPLTLLEAAVDVGSRRHIMQSVAFTYDPRSGHDPHVEDDPQYADPPRPWDQALRPYAVTEGRVEVEPALEGIVLRYGFFYGPHTHMAADGSLAELVRRRRYPVVGDGEGVYSFIHVDDAAAATVAAAERGTRGIYNVVDDTPQPVREWLPAYAEVLGAKAPRRVPVWVARLATGAIPTHFSTTLHGASNAKVRDALGWTPMYPDPRQGFRADLG